MIWSGRTRSRGVAGGGPRIAVARGAVRRRCALSAAALGAVAVLVFPSVASAQTGAPLETLTVMPNPTGGDGPVATSTKQLKAGTRYRLVVTGEVTLTTPFDPGNYIRSDAAYCFESTAPGCEVRPPPVDSRLLLRADGTNGLPEKPFYFLRGSTSPPAYEPSHRYELAFTPKAPTHLLAMYRNILNATGSFTVQIYGPPRRPRRPRSCPRRRGSRATAAAKCHWYVSFHVSQRGLPSKPKPSEELAVVETNAVGRVYFNREPRPFRKSFGSLAGFIGISADYVVPPPAPFEPYAYEASIWRFAQAQYLYGGGLRFLRFDFLAFASSFPDCPANDAEGAVRLVDDALGGGSDELRFAQVHRGCSFGWGTFEFRHNTNRLKVAISKPRQL
jgi:hypothetical protein